MKLSDLTNLVHLRRFLYEIQNGFGSLSKEDQKGLNVKIREIDSIVVKASLSTDFKELAASVSPVNVSTTDADFEASTKMVLDSRKKLFEKDGVEEEKFTKFEANLLKEIVSNETVAKEVKSKEDSEKIKKQITKKKPAFNRTDE